LVDTNWNPSCQNITADYHVLRAVAVQQDLVLEDARSDYSQLIEHAQTPGLGGLPQAIVVTFDLFDYEASTQSSGLVSPDRIRGVGVCLSSSNKTQLDSLEAKLDLINKRQLSIDLCGDVEMLMHTVSLTKRYAVPIVCNLSACTSQNEHLNCTDWPALAQALAGNPNVFVKLTNAIFPEPHVNHASAANNSATAQSHDLTQAIQALVDCVGMHRILFGSASHSVNQEIICANWRCFDKATLWASATDRDFLFRRNAVQLYKL
jgi:predicted TIM-barrel fold metal-dependent hydrolase